VEWDIRSAQPEGKTKNLKIKYRPPGTKRTHWAIQRRGIARHIYNRIRRRIAKPLPPARPNRRKELEMQKIIRLKNSNKVDWGRTLPSISQSVKIEGGRGEGQEEGGVKKRLGGRTGI